MQRHHSLFVGLLLLGAANAQGQTVHSAPPTGATSPHRATLPSTATKIQVAKNFGHLPLAFEPNQGQADSKTRFLSHSLGGALSLNAAEAVFTLPSQPNAHSKNVNAARVAGQSSVATLRMQLVGANPRAATQTQQPMEGRVNYFTDHESSAWHSNIPTFGKVGFRGVYPGVDVVYYGNQNQLEYDFVVAPHADPKQIQLHFGGAQQVRVNSAGDLIVQAQGRKLTWQKPTVYQRTAGGKRSVAAHFHLKHLPNGQTDVRFALGRYDTDRSLVIDPVLIYSSRLEGTLSPHAVLALDSAGSVYVAGTTEEVGMITRTPRTYVFKMNAAGTGLVYSTYLGPTDYGEPAIAVDSSGSAYIAVTGTPTFPTTPGAYKTAHSDTSELAVAKLNPSGSALVYSTFIGKNRPASSSDGVGIDGVLKAGNGIAVDSSGSAYVTGSAGSGWPTTPGAFQMTTNAPGSANAFVTKLNPTGSALAYSTYLGGSVGLGSVQGDTGRGIAVDSSGSAYVVGATASTDFPTTPGAFQRVNKAAANNYTAFVTKLNPTGSGLTYSTLLGGSTNEKGNAIAINEAGEAYVTGRTDSLDFPTTPGAYQTAISPFGAFVTKLDASGSSLIYSTLVGPGVMAYGIAIDRAGSAYITGLATTSQLVTTVGAFQRQRMGFSVGFVTRLNPQGTGVLYSTYLGRSTLLTTGQGDQGDSIAVDSSGNVYVSGVAESDNFPTTSGAFQSPGGGLTFLTKLAPVNIYPDFNNDGFTDLFIQNASTGQIASWFMQGAQVSASANFSQTPPADFTLIGAGDFDGADSFNGFNNALVLQSKTTNQIAFWFTGGENLATIRNGAFVNVTPPTDWKVVGIGDFNEDGKSDLVLQNQSDGRIAIWFMNGYAYAGGALLPIAPLTGWQVVGVGDFNKDGFADIAFQNQSTGQIALWYLNRTNYVGGTVLAATPSSDYKVVGVGDYNGDGSADLLFQNQTTNQAVVWYLQNGVYTGGSALSLTPPPGWKVAGPR